MGNALAQFGGRPYVSLETYKQSGQAVPTPVWFCIDRGRLYVSTPQHTGKVKRLHNNPEVRLALCSSTGKLKGPWVSARAHFVDGPEAANADRMLKRKYGMQRLILDLVSKLRGWRYVMLAIEFDPS
jgi:PPOX class probable F420-dependent enzyme